MRNIRLRILDHFCVFRVYDLSDMFELASVESHDYNAYGAGSTGGGDDVCPSTTGAGTGTGSGTTTGAEASGEVESAAGAGATSTGGAGPGSGWDGGTSDMVE